MCNVSNKTFAGKRSALSGEGVSPNAKKNASPVLSISNQTNIKSNLLGKFNNESEFKSDFSYYLCIQ